MNRAKGRYSVFRGVWRSVIVSLAALALSVLAALVVQAATIYVDESAPGANNGSSWANAYTDLQTALAAASSGDEIWVAKGTYKPGTVQTASFQLKNGVALYGGYPSGGGSRDWKNNETILSGDLIGNDADWANRSDNSYHVVIGSGTNNTAVLDGFTVSSGCANGTYPNERGGGMYNSPGSPTVSNCTFSGNKANAGGGVQNESSSPTVTNCTFSGNEAQVGGGMYNIAGSNPTVTNCTFSGNTAWPGSEPGGGGMYNDNSSPTVTNCTFSGNTGGDNGGGMCNFDNSSPTVTNCTFSGNTASGGSGGGIYNTGSNTTLKNTILAGNAPDDCYGSVTSLGYNLEGSTTCGCTQTTDQQNTDPLLGPLQDNGGPTYTCALLPGSPAIDAIPPPYNGAPATDQRGVTRPQPAGGYCDIGAVEMELAYAKGDVNGDGAIDLIDVRLCAQIAQGVITGTPQQRAAADVDDDGDVDMDDVTILSEYVLGARTTFP